MHTMPSEQVDSCSCQGLEPLIPQPAAGRGGGGGSCTAPLWPPREVQVAPKPSRVLQGQCPSLAPAGPKRWSEGSVPSRRVIHTVPGHLRAPTDPSEWLGDPSPAPHSPDTPAPCCWPVLPSHGVRLSQRAPRVLRGHSPNPRLGTAQVKDDEALLLFGHPHLLHGWAGPGLPLAWTPLVKGK